MLPDIERVVTEKYALTKAHALYHFGYFPEDATQYNIVRVLMEERAKAESEEAQAESEEAESEKAQAESEEVQEEQPEEQPETDADPNFQAPSSEMTSEFAQEKQVKKDVQRR